MSPINSKKKKITDITALVCFVLSVMFFVASIGFTIRHKNIFPTNIILQVVSDVQKPKGRHFLYEAKYDKWGAQVYDKESMADGLTLINVMQFEDHWSPSLLLIDAEGTVHHTWHADILNIWPESPHSDSIAGSRVDRTNNIHGFYLFENGDVLFNFEYLGLVRMNSKGDVLWKFSTYRTHHSLFRAEDGNFWVGGMHWRDDNEEGRKISKRYPGIEPPFAEDFLLKISPEGEILDEISVLDLLFKNKQESTLWRTFRFFKSDPTHLNDIEELSSVLANEYLHFDQGDLVISLRNSNTVCVLDPRTKVIKWTTTEPFVGQHDPDFIGNGRVGVFDNGYDTTPQGEFGGRSRILSIDVNTKRTEVLYEKSDFPGFYTGIMGKFQLLSNGNLLITEAVPGRVFEVDSQGRLLWEWLEKPYDGKMVSEVREGQRYLLTPEQVALWPKNNENVGY